MELSICNETFQGWTWDATCRFVAGAGYDAVEIAPFTLTDDVRKMDADARRGVREQADRAGIAIAGLHWLLVSPRGLSATTLDEAVRSETADYLVALADFCADVGGRVMVFGSPAQRRIPEGESVESTAERFMSTLRPALDRASERGVVVCLEPLPPPEADFLLTLEEAVQMVRRLARPAARTIFDVKSASAEGGPLGDLVRAHACHIAHVHANDANRRGPGFGETDFRPILAALREVGYAGYVSVEVFDYSPDPQTIATESLRYLRSCLGPEATGVEPEGDDA